MCAHLPLQNSPLLLPGDKRKGCNTQLLHAIDQQKTCSKMINIWLENNLSFGTLPETKNLQATTTTNLLWVRENEEGKKEAKFAMPDLFQSKNTHQRENPGHQGNSWVLLPHKKPAAEYNLLLLRFINGSTSYFYEALCKWKYFSAERKCRMENHRSQDRRQKKKKVEIYTYRTATAIIIPKASFVCVPFSGLFALSTACFLCTT
jgi:hypothetical protein